jgi:N-acyl amino acid synthase of PEP-CTERM/exosortase system
VDLDHGARRGVLMLYSQVTQNEQFYPLTNPKLSDEYRQWFELIPADTPALREEAYRLRYQVYCCENHYETPEEHPKHMETDVFDCRSIHSLIIDRANGMTLGTVRLILPEPESLGASFPIQQICSHPLPIKLPMSGTAEISRFALSKKLRKLVDGDCPKNLRCSIVLGLMKAIVQMSWKYGITDWLAVMEPSLLRLLRRFGIYFAPVGPMVEYHGVRQPCHANVGRMLERVRQENLDLWKFATDSRVFWNEEKACCADARIGGVRESAAVKIV